MFFTPLGLDAALARGMFARMRAAASTCLAWISALDTNRAEACSPASAVAARSGRNARAREPSIVQGAQRGSRRPSSLTRPPFMRPRPVRPYDGTPESSCGPPRSPCGSLAGKVATPSVTASCTGSASYRAISGSRRCKGIGDRGPPRGQRPEEDVGLTPRHGTRKHTGGTGARVI